MKEHIEGIARIICLQRGCDLDWQNFIIEAEQIYEFLTENIFTKERIEQAANNADHDIRENYREHSSDVIARYMRYLVEGRRL